MMFIRTRSAYIGVGPLLAKMMFIRTRSAYIGPILAKMMFIRTRSAYIGPIWANIVVYQNQICLYKTQMGLYGGLSEPDLLI